MQRFQPIPRNSSGLPKDAYTRSLQVRAIADFRDEYGRWPSSTGDTPQERTLARHVRSLRDEPQHEDIVEYIRELLGDLPVKAYRGSGVSLAEALRQFKAEHGRSPKASGSTKEERSLAKRAYRAGVKTKRPLAQIRRSTPAPAVRRPFYDDRQFTARVRDLLATRDRLGHWPRKSSPEAEEKSLAEFKARLRRSLPDTYLVILQNLDPDLATWAGDRRTYKAAAFDADVRAIAVYIARHGHRPRHRDEDPEVRRLARLLSSIRNEGVTGTQRAIISTWLPSFTPPSIEEARAKRKRA